MVNANDCQRENFDQYARANNGNAPFRMGKIPQSANADISFLFYKGVDEALEARGLKKPLMVDPAMESGYEIRQTKDKGSPCHQIRHDT